MKLLIHINVMLEAWDYRQALTIQQQKNYRQVIMKYPRPFKTLKVRTVS